MRTILMVLSLFMSAAALASPLELYGIGLSGAGRGLANVAGARDLFATFYNPAGLMDIKSIEFGLAHQINAPFVALEMSREDPSFEPAEPSVYQNTSLGFAVPFTGRLAGRASLGAVLEVPNGILVRARALDTRRPHWFMYDSYPDVFVSQVALAIRFFEGLDLAVGVHNNTGLQGRVTLELDAATNTWTQRELDFEFTGQLGPTVGLKAYHKNWHFGLVYRSPLAMDFATPADLAFNNLDAGLRLELAGVVHMLPTVLASGLEWRTTRWSLELAAQWKQWSSARDPSIDAGLDISGSDAEALGLGQALDAPDPEGQPRQSPGFRDTLSVGLGGSFSFRNGLQTQAGYSFIPSPIPDQIHHTNLVDPDRHVLSMSLIWKVIDPLGVFTKPLGLGFSCQWNHLAKRRAEKTLGPVDPVGDWTATGGILSLNFGFEGRL
jgi:long-chain fatty acid transport protein